MQCFLEFIVHVHHAADAAIRVLANPLAIGLEIFRLLRRFPRALEILDDVVAVAGIDEAHVADEFRKALEVFGAEILTDLIAIDAEHRAPAKAFRSRSAELEEFRLRRPILQIDDRARHRIR